MTWWLTLLDVVSVAESDVDANECVDDSFYEILNLNICQDIEGEFLSRFWSKFFVKTLKLNSGQDFSSFFVILRLNLGRDFEDEFDEDFEA